MSDLATRYGTPSRSRKPVVVALVVLLAGAGLSWLAWAALFHSRPLVQSGMVRFDVVDASTATAEFTVVRRDEDVEASCLLRAVAEDGSIVGEVQVAVDSGAAERTLRQEVRTERLATTVDLVGCVAPGQAQRR